LFNKVERLISSRNLKPKKKESFLKIISLFSFVGIMLGVAILIIVMSVMNGFRTDLTNKILGLNPHITIEPASSIIDNDFIKKLKNKFNNIKLTQNFNGQAISMTKNSAKGLLVKSLNKNNLNNLKFLKEKIITGDYQKFKKGSILIGRELSYDLDLSIGDSLTLMSSSFISTPLGEIPKQESYEVVGIFSSGFYEFDQNVVFLNISDVLSLFNKSKENLNIEIFLKDPSKANIIKEEIKNINDNFYIFTWIDLNKSFFSALKVERNVMFIILTLIIIVAAFNIISGLTILIKNKTREIAILKTLGLNNNSIVKIFFLTGLTIGFSASVTGVLIGSLFSIYIEKVRMFILTVFNFEIFPSDIYFLDSLPSELDFGSTLVIFIFSLFITAIASYFPARGILKMNTIKALKYE